MARVLLLIPETTYRAGAFIDAATHLGLDIVVASPEAHVLSSVMGPRALSVSFDDPLSAARSIVDHDMVVGVDAVVAVDDQGALVAAHAGGLLGLVHNPPQAVAATLDKLEMRRRLRDAEVPQPQFASLPSRGDAWTSDPIAQQIGFPCVIKPTTLSASQGVIRADDPSQAKKAARRSRQIAAQATGRDPDDVQLLVESFVPGPELAVEAIVVDGELTVLAIFDKPDPLDGPYFEETIYVTPSRLPDADQQAAVDLVRRSVTALGLGHGPVHAEVRVQKGRAALIELAARTIGGLCSRALCFAGNASLEEIVLRNALGLDVVSHTEPSGESSGIMMLPIPRAGILEAVAGKEDALAVKGIEALEITVPIGHRVIPVPDANRYLGFLFARTSTPYETEQALRQGFSRLRIRITDANCDFSPGTPGAARAADRSRGC